MVASILGCKFDAGKLAIAMHHEQFSNGTQMFAKDEYLTAQQITSYWSHYAATVRAQGASARQQATNQETVEVPLAEHHDDPNLVEQEAVYNTITC